MQGPLLWLSFLVDNRSPVGKAEKEDLPSLQLSLVIWSWKKIQGGSNECAVHYASVLIQSPLYVIHCKQIPAALPGKAKKALLWSRVADLLRQSWKSSLQPILISTCKHTLLYSLNQKTITCGTNIITIRITLVFFSLFVLRALNSCLYCYSGSDYSLLNAWVHIKLRGLH